MYVEDPRVEQLSNALVDPGRLIDWQWRTTMMERAIRKIASTITRGIDLKRCAVCHDRYGASSSPCWLVSNFRVIGTTHTTCSPYSPKTPKVNEVSAERGVFLIWMRYYTTTMDQRMLDGRYLAMSHTMNGRRHCLEWMTPPRRRQALISYRKFVHLFRRERATAWRGARLEVCGD